MFARHYLATQTGLPPGFLETPQSRLGTVLIALGGIPTPAPYPLITRITLHSLCVKKAAPMVGDVFSLKSFEQNRRTRDDFPTAASPESSARDLGFVQYLSGMAAAGATGDFGRISTCPLHRRCANCLPKDNNRSTRPAPSHCPGSAQVSSITSPLAGGIRCLYARAAK